MDKIYEDNLCVGPVYTFNYLLESKYLERPLTVRHAGVVTQRYSLWDQPIDRKYDIKCAR